MDFLSTFGISPLKFVVQSIIWLLPAIWATVHVVRRRTGRALPLWLILIWFLPIVGALLALFIVRHPDKQNA